MANQVLTLSQEQIKDLESQYSAFKKETPPHAHYRIQLPGVSFTAYLSGKVLFQGPEVEKFLTSKGLGLAPSDGKSKKTAESESSLPTGFSTWSVVGSDEVGTGAYFGPLTVAAAYVSSDKIEQCKALGLRDSKSLTDTQIQEIANLIRPILPHKIKVVSPAKYNQAHETRNMNAIKALLHNQVLQQLSQELGQATIHAYLIDQFAQPKTYYNYLKGVETVAKEKTYFATKGESKHLAVAAASILARDAFLRGLKDLSAQSGYQLLAGAGSAEDQLAAQILRLDGMETLAKLAKIHFANTEKALKILEKTN